MTQFIKLTKLDAAERQLNQAIKLFFAEDDAVSIHTLAEAASQVLADIGKTLGVESLARDSNLIREEKKKEWLKAIFTSRNFFKHADKDPNSVHDFNPQMNVYTLLDCVCMHVDITKKWTPETHMYLVWCELAHPELFEKRLSDAAFEKLGGLPDPSNKQLFLEVINLRRTQNNLSTSFKL